MDPAYITYPFGDKLLTIARERRFNDIAKLLEDYHQDPSRCKYKGDNGEIFYNRTPLQLEFQKVVDKENIKKTRAMLEANPELVHDDLYFWGEGLLMMPAKDGNAALIKLLLSYGAKVPTMSKWGRFYYFKHYKIAALLMENGMEANHMTWHRTTLLHDIAQEGDSKKAKLLLQYGASIDPIEEQYQSTPLGMAARWGRVEMVELLLQHGADPNQAGASWATPLAWAQVKGHPATERILRNAGAHA